MDDDAPLSAADAALLLAVCRGDVTAAAAALSAGAAARRRVRRADAAATLGPDAYLGSQWWATQDHFPLLYFAGARCPAARREQALASAAALADVPRGPRTGVLLRCRTAPRAAPAPQRPSAAPHAPARRAAPARLP
jgi:hypothetical protein